MYRRTRISGAILILFVMAASVPQASSAIELEEESSPKSLDLMVNGVGISFGNSKRVIGLRFNIRDEGVEEVTGLNFTLWKPGENPDAVMRGLQLGIYGPSADELGILSVGIAAVHAYSRISGIAVAGGAVVSEGSIHGIALSGFANVADGGMFGISASGLANVATGGVNGIAIGGLANVAEGYMKGISIGGLANVSQSGTSGISIGGLANVAEGFMTGISIGGLANVSQGGINGVSVGGLANVSEGRLTGISVGGLATVSEGGMRGIHIGGLAAVAEGYMTGVSVGGLAAVSEAGMSGITIGGLAVVAEGEMTGITIGGLAAINEDGLSGINVGGFALITEGTLSGINATLGGIKGARLDGINVGAIGIVAYNEDDDEGEEGIVYTGIKAESAKWLTVHGIDIDVEDEIIGLAVSGIRIHAGSITGGAASLVMLADEMRGFNAGCVNYFDGLQVGLSIGIYNYAEHLNGIQIGLVNIANNKSKPFRVLPIVNAHFD